MPKADICLKIGGVVDNVYYSVDVTDFKALSCVIKLAVSEVGKISGVVHLCRNIFSVAT